LASGKDDFLSEYAAVKQISLGTKMNLEEIGVKINKVLDFKKCQNF
jgi:hypothetical protein